MKVVVRGNSKYGEVSLSAQALDLEWFEPTAVEIYKGEQGQETLAETHQIDGK